MNERTKGSVYAILAFACWGMFPLYFKLVADVPAVEMLAHRVVWVMVSVWPVILVLGWIRRIRTVFMDRMAFRFILCSTAILTVNWLIFIWAMANGFVLQSSLAYFITPLVNVVLGVMILGERLRRIQWTSVGLAGTGVCVTMVVQGELPWIALSLAVTFGLYGLLRKQAPVDAMTGLFVETLMVAPLALLYLVWITMDGSAFLSWDSGSVLVSVIAAGGVTAIPLVLFAGGARRLPLSLLGFFQYIVPTGHFVLAVFVFGEEFTQWHLLSFALIWAALALYTTDAFRNRRTTETDADA